MRYYFNIGRRICQVIKKIYLTNKGMCGKIVSFLLVLSNVTNRLKHLTNQLACGKIVSVCNLKSIISLCLLSVMFFAQFKMYVGDGVCPSKSGRCWAVYILIYPFSEWFGTGE